MDMKQRKQPTVMINLASLAERDACSPGIFKFRQRCEALGVDPEVGVTLEAALADQDHGDHTWMAIEFKYTGAITRPDGTQEFYRDGQLHRDGGPAITRPDGSQSFWRDGWRHRDDGPAITHADGSQSFWRDGRLHRDDGPAIIYANGYQAFYRNGQCHRDDGPAITHADGSQEYWRDGVRVEGPSR